MPQKTHSPTTFPTPLYSFTLPTDTRLAQVEALTCGCLDAIRDYPLARLSRVEIEAQARARCNELKARTPRLTNDFESFCRLFILDYADNHQQSTRHYDANVHAYQEDSELFESLPWEEASALRKASLLVMLANMEVR